MNSHMNKLEDIVDKDLKTEKEKCHNYFLREVSTPNIKQAGKQIIGI